MNRAPDLQKLVDGLAREVFGRAPSDVPGKCIACCCPFNEHNVFTEAGWRETKISGLCEKCFDEICKEDDNG